MGENLETKVAKLEQKTDYHEQRLFSVETDNKALTKLANTLDQQMKQSNERDERHSQVLDKINDNLTGLNSRFDHVEKRVGHLENRRIDFNELWKTTIFKIVPSIIGGLALAYLVIQFGLNK